MAGQGRHEKFALSTVIEALRKTGGNALTASRVLNCSPQTIRNITQKHASVREALKQIREIEKDRAEANIRAFILRRNLPATMFFLKCQAKDRGWVERQEFAAPAGGGGAQVHIYVPREAKGSSVKRAKRIDSSEA